MHPHLDSSSAKSINAAAEIYRLAQRSEVSLCPHRKREIYTRHKYGKNVIIIGRVGRTNLFPGALQSLLIESEINHVLMGLQGARAGFNFARCVFYVCAPYCIKYIQWKKSRSLVIWSGAGLYIIFAQKKGRDYCQCILPTSLYTCTLCREFFRSIEASFEYQICEYCKR